MALVTPCFVMANMANVPHERQGGHDSNSRAC